MSVNVEQPKAPPMTGFVVAVPVSLALWAAIVLPFVLG